ncbi:UNVERIFIED_CONTAM: hypothetical protein Sradi_4562300 [Sesamum radiatum]|uniref:Uncharacterized protein n=1 Tax=Sesamum radiatum TaxID=300843 RepID=A0AAW2N9L3_SESRA
MSRSRETQQRVQTNPSPAQLGPALAGNKHGPARAAQRAKPIGQVVQQLQSSVRSSPAMGAQSAAAPCPAQSIQRNSPMCWRSPVDFCSPVADSSLPPLSAQKIQS